MKTGVAILSVLFLPLLANAGDFGLERSLKPGARDAQLYLHAPITGRELISFLRTEHRFEDVTERSSLLSATHLKPDYESPLAKEIRLAWKKGIIEQSFLGYTNVLIACQRAQSPLLTIPFQTADSQQNHCFRF